MTLTINNAAISRRHAEISFANDHYVLHDLGSSNGTFVNDVRLVPGSLQILKPDDRIRFEKITFVFQLRHVDPAASALFKRQAGGKGGLHAV